MLSFAQTGDDDQLVAGIFYINILEIVLPPTLDDDEVAHRGGIISLGLAALTSMRTAYNMPMTKGKVMRRLVPREGKWTLLFDSTLKKLVISAARRGNISPATLLENIVREKFNPYGHTDVDDSVAYVITLRKQNRKQCDADFLAEIEAWQKSQ